MGYFNMNIGFSTGSLAYSNFKQGIDLLKEQQIPVIEISALREIELEPLLESIDQIDLSFFKYISFHAPSRLVHLSEAELVRKLVALGKKGFPIVVHPDIIENMQRWKELGSLLLIENMDKRKPAGRTALDLEYIFYELSEAGFCLDLAHVRQVDPTMGEARSMIKRFGHRLAQLHVSTINAKSKHEPLNVDALLAYQKVSHLLNPDVPIILESPVPPSLVRTEIQIAGYIFNKTGLLELLGKAGVAVEDFNIVRSTSNIREGNEKASI
jgi:hypothetical protein